MNSPVDGSVRKTYFLEGIYQVQRQEFLGQRMSLGRVPNGLDQVAFVHNVPFRKPYHCKLPILGRSSIRAGLWAEPSLTNRRN